MIVRISVCDNDFGNVLKDYMKDYYTNLLLDLEPDQSLSEEEQGKQATQWIKENRKLKSVMKSSERRELSAEEKEWLLNRTKLSFAKFIDKKPADTQEYLNRRLNVSFPVWFVDKWENGEGCYWFQSSDTAILQ